MKNVVVLLIIAVIVFMIVGLSGVSVGDHLAAKNDVNLIENWNANTFLKPISCTLKKGEKVEVIDIDNIYMGSSEEEETILVSSKERSCTGWGFPRDFRK